MAVALMELKQCNCINKCKTPIKLTIKAAEIGMGIYHPFSPIE